MHIFEYIANTFSGKFYKQEISVKRAALENAGEVFRKTGMDLQWGWRHYPRQPELATVILQQNAIVQAKCRTTANIE